MIQVVTGRQRVNFNIKPMRVCLVTVPVLIRIYYFFFIFSAVLETDSVLCTSKPQRFV